MGFFDKVVGVVAKPFKKIAKGDIAGAAEAGFKAFTIPGRVIGATEGISERHVHIANKTGGRVAVVVAPNRDWVLADISTAVVLLIASCGSSAPSGLKALKNAKNLKEIYQATRYMRGIASVGSKVFKIFSKEGTNIKDGKVVDVRKRSNTNPMNYLDPSQWGAIAGASDFSVMICCEDGRTALFNTNSDQSWIVTSAGVRKAKYGSLWKAEGDTLKWGHD